jgi:hypothetical protein
MDERGSTRADEPGRATTDEHTRMVLVGGGIGLVEGEERNIGWVWSVGSAARKATTSLPRHFHQNSSSGPPEFVEWYEGQE